MDTERNKSEEASKRPPLWLRIVLMTLLILFACYAFWVTYRPVVERLNQ